MEDESLETIVHDIRGELFLILGTVELARAHAKDNPSLLTYLDQIDQQVENTKILIKKAVK